MATRQYGNLETQHLKDRMAKGGSKTNDGMGKIGKPGEDANADHEGHSEHDHAGQEGDHEEIKNVVAEHGVAHSHEHTKDGEHHKVVSHHEDGHTHTSSGHPHAGHAHEHIGHAMGVETGAEQHQEPDEDEAGVVSQGSALGV